MIDIDTQVSLDKAKAFLGDEFSEVNSIQDMSNGEWRTAANGDLVLYVEDSFTYDELVYIYPDGDAWEIDITSAGRLYDEPCCINNARNGFGNHDYDCPFA